MAVKPLFHSWGRKSSFLNKHALPNFLTDPSAQPPNSGQLGSGKPKGDCDLPKETIAPKDHAWRRTQSPDSQPSALPLHSAASPHPSWERGWALRAH